MTKKSESESLQWICAISFLGIIICSIILITYNNHQDNNHQDNNHQDNNQFIVINLLIFFFIVIFIWSCLKIKGIIR